MKFPIKQNHSHRRHTGHTPACGPMWHHRGSVSSGWRCSEEQIKLNLVTALVWFQLLSRRWGSRRGGLFVLSAENDSAKLCLSKRHTKSANDLAANRRARYFWRLRQHQWSFMCADGRDENDKRVIWTLASTRGCLSGQWDMWGLFVCAVHCGVEATL